MQASRRRGSEGHQRRGDARLIAFRTGSLAARRDSPGAGFSLALLVFVALQGMRPAHAQESAAYVANTASPPAASAGSAGRVTGSGEAGASARQRAAERLRRTDADGDGFISRAEAARRAPRLAARFDALDANADGRLSPQEIRGGAKLRRAGLSGLNAPALREGRLAAADRDGDGRLSREEAASSLPRIAAKFARIDGDGNGFVDAHEFRGWIERRRSARNAARPRG